MASKPSPMNAGDGEHSYAKNSSYQKNSLDASKDAMLQVIMESLDVEKQLIKTDDAGGLSLIRIVDLGCSSGPNTFFAMQNIVAAINSKYSSLCEQLEFQVFFNDQTYNDFNALFTSLPNYNNSNGQQIYYAAGVPGSFYDRLFPSSSIHVFHSLYALLWSSKAPEELLIRDSPAWNGGKIHYTGTSQAVYNAYADQFEKDVDAFLKARAEEIVSGGVVIITTPGAIDDNKATLFGTVLVFFGSILQEMVLEGIVIQDQLDTFNSPNLYPSVKQMTRLVEKNGCFTIEKMELRNPHGKIDPENQETGLMHARAAMEGTFANHFGKETVNEMFKRAFQQKEKLSNLFHHYEIENSLELFAVLKRK